MDKEPRNSQGHVPGGPSLPGPPSGLWGFSTSLAVACSFWLPASMQQAFSASLPPPPPPPFLMLIRGMMGKKTLKLTCSGVALAALLIYF